MDHALIEVFRRRKHSWRSRHDAATLAFRCGADAEEPVIEASPAQVIDNTGDEPANNEETSIAEQVELPNFASTILYPDFLPDVDLQYDAYGQNIKESILINSQQDAYSYRFYLELTDLTPILKESGAIALANVDGDEIYMIPAPYMIDDEGVFSDDVHFSLEAVNGGYLLTVTASEAWINEDDRAFPVTIDPALILLSGGTQDDIVSNFVKEQNPTQNCNGSQLYMGNNGGSGKNMNGYVINECKNRTEQFETWVLRFANDSLAVSEHGNYNMVTHFLEQDWNLVDPKERNHNIRTLLRLLFPCKNVREARDSSHFWMLYINCGTPTFPSWKNSVFVIVEGKTGFDYSVLGTLTNARARCACDNVFFITQNRRTVDYVSQINQHFEQYGLSNDYSFTVLDKKDFACFLGQKDRLETLDEIIKEETGVF